MLQKIKTVLFLGFLTGCFMMLGLLIGGSTGLTYAFIAALVMNGLMYFFSDKIALSVYKAQPLSAQDYPEIHTMVEELARQMHIPKPKLWIISSPVANAFATGRNPSHASVAFTPSIITLLEPYELRGVIAHELSHVKNRDILISTIAATLAAAIGYICNYLQHISMYRAINGSSQERNNTAPLISFLVALLMPLIAALIQLAISRSREYLADETGAHTCKDPLALASALEKLYLRSQKVHTDSRDVVQASFAHLFIVSPLAGSRIASLFSTHPPIEQRIKKLRTMFERKDYL